VILTKIDKVKAEDVARTKRDIQTFVHEEYVSAVPSVLASSAQTNSGIAEVRAALLVTSGHITEDPEQKEGFDF
jgi:GTP-binding protein EngB required for normal cell division